jgi:hypothetical protein
VLNAYSLGMPAEMRLAKVIVALLCTAVATALAQRQSFAQDQSSQSTSAYLPKVGDIMGQMQLRHFKLGYAGSLGNWELANYEVGQIRASFDTAAKLYPILGDVPFARRLEEASVLPLTDIANAIAAKDKEDFGIAFERLTTACNTCHSAAHVGFIKMKFPTTSRNFLFSDQIFPPE